MKNKEVIQATEHLYKKTANDIASYIQNGTWKTGDRAPSIRQACRLYKISFTTALKAYYELESQNFIEARPQSGYYVCYSPLKFRQLPQTSKPKLNAKAVPIDDVIQNVFSTIGNKVIGQVIIRCSC